MSRPLKMSLARRVARALALSRSTRRSSDFTAALRRRMQPPTCASLRRSRYTRMSLPCFFRIGSGLGSMKPKPNRSPERARVAISSTKGAWGFFVSANETNSVGET